VPIWRHKPDSGPALRLASDHILLFTAISPLTTRRSVLRHFFFPGMPIRPFFFESLPFEMSALTVQHLPFHRLKSGATPRLVLRLGTAFRFFGTILLQRSQPPFAGCVPTTSVLPCVGFPSFPSDSFKVSCFLVGSLGKIRPFILPPSGVPPPFQFPVRRVFCFFNHLFRKSPCLLLFRDAMTPPAGKHTCSSSPHISRFHGDRRAPSSRAHVIFLETRFYSICRRRVYSAFLLFLSLSRKPSLPPDRPVTASGLRNISLTEDGIHP